MEILGLFFLGKCRFDQIDKLRITNFKLEN